MSESAVAAWLLLLFQLPAQPTSARVQTWRRLRDLGAVALKNAAYALPNTPQSREDFEWLKQEVLTMKGEAMVLTADAVDAAAHDAIVGQFRRAHERGFAAILRDSEAAIAAWGRPRRGHHRSDPALARQIRPLRERLAHLEALAFVRPPNADAAASAVSRLERMAGEGSAPRDSRRLEPRAYQRKVWVTRPRPGVDRMSSAWLIRRFIDPRARFSFAEKPPSGATPFDMYGVEFSHHDGGCTFETLASRFALDDPAVRIIGEIVHDIDLKESKYDRPEAPTVATMVEGLRLTYGKDDELLEHGIAMFEALYRSFAGRPAAAPRAGSRATGRARTAARSMKKGG